MLKSTLEHETESCFRNYLYFNDNNKTISCTNYIPSALYNLNGLLLEVSAPFSLSSRRGQDLPRSQFFAVNICVKRCKEIIIFKCMVIK